MAARSASAMGGSEPGANLKALYAGPRFASGASSRASSFFHCSLRVAAGVSTSKSTFFSAVPVGVCLRLLIALLKPAVGPLSLLFFASAGYP